MIDYGLLINDDLADAKKQSKIKNQNEITIPAIKINMAIAAIFSLNVLIIITNLSAKILLGGIKLSRILFRPKTTNKCTGHL